jgi:hypothetical protein
VAQRDWVEWHRDYDDPGSLLPRRLELVQGHLRAELDGAPAGEFRLISLCAGQGRDVSAQLVELDERHVAVARQAQVAGLGRRRGAAGRRRDHRRLRGRGARADRRGVRRQPWGV